MPLFETITDLDAQAEIVRRRRYGMIEMVDGRLHAVHLRPWAKSVGLHDVLVGQWYHRRMPGNRCWLYYNQPRGHSNFLALKYVISRRGTTLATFHGGLSVLDEIARIKGTDAIVCDLANWRLSARLAARWGWEPHRPSRWHRHYIKRFYGCYPAKPRELARAVELAK